MEGHGGAHSCHCQCQIISLLQGFQRQGCVDINGIITHTLKHSGALLTGKEQSKYDDELVHSLTQDIFHHSAGDERLVAAVWLP